MANDGPKESGVGTEWGADAPRLLPASKIDAGVTAELLKALPEGVARVLSVGTAESIANLNTPEDVAVSGFLHLRSMAAKLEDLGRNGQRLSGTFAYALQEALEAVRSSMHGAIEEFPLKPFEQVVPALYANELVEMAFQIENNRIERERERMSHLRRNITALVTRAMRRKMGDDTTIPDSEEDLLNLEWKCAASLLGKKKPTFSDLYDSLPDLHFSYEDGRNFTLRREDYESVIRSHADLADTFSDAFAFRAAYGPSAAFLKLHKHRAAYKTIRADKVWDELDDSSAPAKDNGFGELVRKLNGEERSHIDSLAIKANSYAEDLFRIGDSADFAFELHGQVSASSDVKELTSLASLEPFDPESLHLALSAIMKLELMHKLLLIEYLPTELFPTIAKHLSARFKSMQRTYREGVVFNPPTDPNHSLTYSAHHVFIDTPVVIDMLGKSILSMIEKLLKKGLPIATDIRDTIRFKIFAPENATYANGNSGEIDTDALKIWCTHVLGIVMSEFGDDIDLVRVRSTILSGGSNPQSTGKHRGLHVTFTFKYRIPENGLRSDGRPKTATIQVEGQFLGHMTREEIAEDIGVYSSNKRETTIENIGAGLSFQELVEDFMRIINSGSPVSKALTLTSERDKLEEHLDSATLEYLDCQNCVGNLEAAPERVDIPALLAGDMVKVGKFNERTVLTFLEILTRRDENGDLVNGDVLNELNAHRRASLVESLQKCLEWPQHFLKSKFAHVIEHRARLILHYIDHPQGARTINRALVTGGKKRAKGVDFRLRSTPDGVKSAKYVDINYTGPVKQICKVPNSEDPTERHFYDVDAVNGKESKKKLRYIIRPAEDHGRLPVCYLIADNGYEVPIWFVDYEATNTLGSEGRYVIRRYTHVIDRKPNNKPYIREEDISENVKQIRPQDFSTLKPVDGMEPVNAQRYAFVKYSQQKTRKRKKKLSGTRPKSSKN